MSFLKIKNRAFSTLASGISDTALSLTVDTGDGAKFPSSGDFHITVYVAGSPETNAEIMNCTSRSTDVLTVVRAQEGTAAAAHVSGEVVALRITAGVINQIETDFLAHTGLETAGVHGSASAATASKLVHRDASARAKFAAPAAAGDALIKGTAITDTEHGNRGSGLHSDSHAQGSDTTLGALGTKATPIDADKVVHRNSASADALVTSTWTQVKAFLKTYFDGIYRLATADHSHQSAGAQAGKLDHGLALNGLGDDDHTQYIKHSLATAVSDFLVASGAGVFIKKTLAEVKTILGLGTAAYTATTDYVTHALATAANDFIVASGSGTFIKKTLAEVETLLDWAADIATHAAVTATHGATGAVVGTTNTQTLTNKTLIATTNVVEEITTVASDATPNPTGGSLRNFYTITALAEAAEFAAPSGTPANANKLIIRIKDNATARALTWNAIYRAMEFALPTTTVISKTLYVGFIYNSTDSKWDMLAINTEA